MNLTSTLVFFLLDADAQNVPANEDEELIPRTLPDIGPRITLDQLLMEFLEPSNFGKGQGVQLVISSSSYGTKRPPITQRPPLSLRPTTKRPVNSQTSSVGTSKTPVRLPTPIDGCGVSQVRRSRIVGGGKLLNKLFIIEI